jgi:acyl carrier protein
MTENARVKRRMAPLEEITPETGFPILEGLLEAGCVQACVLPVRSWPSFFAARRDLACQKFFSRVNSLAAVPGKTELEPAMRTKLEQEPMLNRRRLLLEHLNRLAALVLGLAASTRTEESVALRDIGLDSLMSVELRNAIALSLEQRFPATLVLDHPTLGTLADYILNEIFAVAEKDPGQGAGMPFEIADLSETEAESLLLAELDASPRQAHRWR